MFNEDTPLNYAMLEHMDDFKVTEFQKIVHPTAEEIEANKQKWGWTG